jgi:MtrB/PioB family decaheme-associated outer membrane protein
MKNRNTVLRTRPLTIALRAALATLAVAAVAPAAFADDALQALIQPTNTVTLGVQAVDSNAPLYGEYNGLNKSGGKLLGDFSLRGGDGYGQQPGNQVWSLSGKDLGTTSRSLDGTIGEQGSWSLGLSYDQLRHYDGNSTTGSPSTFQMPYVEGAGSNSFTLPSAFGYVNSARGSTGTQGLTATQKAFFHTVDLYTERDTTRFDAKHEFGREWNMAFSWTNIKQSGGVLQGGSVDAQTLSPGGSSSPAHEDPVFFPMPTEFNTNNFDVSVNWAGEKGFFTGGFYGSRFRDSYNAVYFQNPYSSTAISPGDYPTDLLSTYPSNEDNELHLSGGYHITPTTQLVGGYSYGRNTQNMAYGIESAMTGQAGVPAVPATSLNGKVITQHANWRLSNQTTRNLALSAGMTYTKRDNQTPSNVYWYWTPSGDNDPAVNIAESYSILKTNVASDLKLTERQRLHVGLTDSNTRRWCDNAIANSQTIVAADGVTYNRTGCAQVPQMREDKLDAVYHNELSDKVSFHGGVNYSNRRSTLNPNFYNPIQSPEPDEGQGFENPGFVAYFQASRKEAGVVGGVNWQVSPAVNVSVDGNFGNDSYGDSALGVQHGHNENVNLEADFAVAANTSVSAYASWQQQNRNLLSETGSLGATGTKAIGQYKWFNTLDDKATTLGVSAKRTGLMGGRLDVRGDLSYSLGESTYATSVVPNSGTTATATIGTCAAAYTCGTVPTIRTGIVRLNLSGTYNYNKQAKIVFGYGYAHLNSNDYMYASEQVGYTPTGVMPINEQNPSYTVNTVYLAYRYSFR